MVSLVASAILCLIFGFFIYETITQFNKLFGLSLNPYLGIVAAVLVYAFHEFLRRKLRANQKVVSTNKPMKPKCDKVFYFIAWTLVASLFLSVFVLWAGMIYKQIMDNL